MNLQDFAHLIRSRWITVVTTMAIAVAGAVLLTVLTTPLYQASTRLFVSTAAGASANEIYQGTLFSQQRVLSYTKLLEGETLARRTIEKLDLDMRPTDLQEKVKAESAPDTVLIDVSVLDASPVRARDIADALSDEFVVMVSDLETPEEGARPDARVVVEQRASIPTSPVVPKKTLNLAGGLLLGLVLGLAFAYLRDRFDNTVKTSQTLEEITGVGTVATIPFDRDRRNQPGISFVGDNSAIAEAFRELRTNLQFLEVDNPPRALVVTSSLPGEGKTTVALNLALALAEAEHSVILVDGDLRRPKIATRLQLIGSVGFSTVLTGRATLDEVIQKTRVPGLSVLTSGAAPPNPSELLGSQSAKKVLSELNAHFDFVIVDSSPLLAVTDAAILSASADGVLVMAHFGATKRDQLAHAVGNLRNVGAPLLGAVFTMTPTKGKGSYRYSYYEEGGRAPSRAAGGQVSGRRRRDPEPRRRFALPFWDRKAL